MSSSAAKPSLTPSKVAVIGCPFSCGQPRAGVEAGAISLVEAGLVQQIEQLGYSVRFDGHNQFDPANRLLLDDADIGKMKFPRTVSGVAKSVADIVSKHALAGELPLTLGGDHSLALGTVSGVLRAHPTAGVIWVDAHADINTPLTTDTGNLHGCPVSFLMGLPGTSVAPFTDWLPATPVLKPDSIVYIGLRDVDAPEKKILRENGIKAFSMHEVDRYGIGRVVDMALDYLNGGVEGKRERPIHLSFDVDALDPTVAPSTGTPVRGGLSFREGHYICEAIFQTGNLVAMDLMEVNPSLSPTDAEATVTIGCSLIRSALGETLL
ncbi:Arginase, catabolizes arginine to ornithine and urea [Tilletia horrida]|uniref:Arginase n=1 Tax=Tilletia horrida TaxID=155126 RepID=A0AAN6G6S5_9BASI|nr:Arginase, catabolizes arginine to ornithine and urea [Tilletia horrida]KAK0530656.1 Arginase, catabolizes arginine to ornithine and urea [Tilletia horrida]